MKTKIAVWLAWLLLFGYVLMAAPPVEEGKTLFTTRCAACHNVHKNLTGPALAGVDKRRSLEWIIRFVHSSQTMVKSGDKDAVAIFEQFNKIPMPDHPDLTNEQIGNIVEYIKTAGEAVAATPLYIPGRKKTNYTPLSFSDYGLITGYLLAVIVLLLAFYFVVYAKTLNRSLR